MNRFPSGRIPSKKVYLINNVVFYKDTSTINKKKCQEYCLNNLLDLNEIVQYDSYPEYLRHKLLQERQQSGEIRDLKMHFTFPLLPEFTAADGTVENRMDYEADFYYFDNTLNKYVVEDVKGGFIEDTFKIKRKIFNYKYKDKDLYIVVLRYSETTGWCLFDEYKSAKKRLEKLKAENKVLKEKEKERQKYEKENEKFLARYNELKLVEKKTKAQRIRFEFLDSTLTERGIIH